MLISRTFAVYIGFKIYVDIMTGEKFRLLFLLVIYWLIRSYSKGGGVE